MDKSVDVDLLIVGAGPVGLFLANECARRGLRPRLVELNASQSTHSKALAIFPRTLEIFDMAGIVLPFLEVANRVTSVAVLAHQRMIADLRFAPEGTPYPFVAMVPQDVTEKLLAEELHRRGGSVEYDTTFRSAEERDGCVMATIERDGQQQSLTASFVVGCDGAHSAVRHLLNLPFAGGEYEDLFLLADVETNESLPASQMQLCPSEFGPMAIFPMSASRRRIVATVDHKQGDAPSLDIVRDILRQRGPNGVEARALNWATYFRIHHRQVASLRSGRVFLAGDAAHIHSPFGGQGMNTGLQDAWNLAWKLKLYLHASGSDELLESYSIERIPVIKDVIETTDRLTKVMGTSSKFAQVLRDLLIPAASRLRPFERAFVRKLSGLALAYRSSPLIDGRSERYFDDSLRGGKGIGNRFLVMVGPEKTDSQAARQLCEKFSDIAELRLATDPGITLVRPDGYVACVAESGAGDSAFARVESVLARHVGEGKPAALRAIGSSAM